MKSEDFFTLSYISPKVEQPLQGTELQEKHDTDEKQIRKMILEKTQP